MRKTLLWMTLLLAGGCAGAQKPDSEGAETKPGTVAFSFDWPASMTMDVQLHRERALRSAGSVSTWEGDTRFNLVTVPQEDGLLVRTEQVRWEGQPIDTIPKVIERAYFTGMPSFVVAEVGDLVRLEGVSEVLAAYADQAGVDLSVLNEAARSNVDTQVQQNIQSTARDLWQNLVGFWAGRELNIGQPVKRRSSTTLAALGNRSVTQYLNYQVMGRVPCDTEVPVPSAQATAEAGLPAPEPMPEMGEMPAEGEMGEMPAEGEMGEMPAEGEMGEMPAEGEMGEMPAEGEMGETPAEGEMGETPAEGEMRETPAEGELAEAEPEAEVSWTPTSEIPNLGQGQCVWIELNSSYDPAALQTALEGQPEKEGAPRFTDLKNDVRVILVTDPKGLKPHQLVRTQSAQVELVQPDGTPQAQAEEHVSAWKFDYPAAQ